MKVQNEITGEKYTIAGTYFDKSTGIGHVYLNCENGDTKPVTLGELMSSYKDLAPEPASRIDEAGWEQNGIKSKLANIIIAPVDYTEGDKKYFTFDEACAIEKKLDNGWRLPTRLEWVLICEEFGQKDGELNTETLMKNLNLEKNGVLYREDDSPSYAGNYGFYWSSTPVSDGAYAYRLYFYGTDYISPSATNDRRYGYSVRLVRDLK